MNGPVEGELQRAAVQLTASIYQQSRVVQEVRRSYMAGEVDMVGLVAVEVFGACRDARKSDTGPVAYRRECLSWPGSVRVVASISMALSNWLDA